MKITIDTEKDFDKIREIIINCPPEVKSELIKTLKEDSSKRALEAHKNISMVLEQQGITKDDMLNELKALRAEKQRDHRH